MSASVARRGPRTIEREPALRITAGSVRKTCRSDSPPATTAAPAEITAVKSDQPPVEANLERDRFGGKRNCTGQQRRRGAGDEQRRERREHREQQRFDDQLPRQPRAPGADRHTNAELGLPCCEPRDQQAAGIRAGDEQQHRDECHAERHRPRQLSRVPPTARGWRRAV